MLCHIKVVPPDQDLHCLLTEYSIQMGIKIKILFNTLLIMVGMYIWLKQVNCDKTTCADLNVIFDCR